MSIGKLIRTLQSEFSFLKEGKDAAYYHARRLLKHPHEGEFRALRFVPDSLAGGFLDVGANQGQSVESIRIFKPNAPIHCFEANGLLAEKLRGRYAGHSKIQVESFGLADKKQSRPLYIPVYKNFVYDGLASFDKEFASTWLSDETLYWFSPAKLKLLETPCATERLDDLNLNPIVIKIVVQGFQYQVVNGGVGYNWTQPQIQAAVIATDNSLGYAFGKNDGAQGSKLAAFDIHDSVAGGGGTGCHLIIKPFLNAARY